jgi:ATP-dependent Lon protease
MECRRRVKEQQKRIGSAEFRNTQFSYSMGDDGVEKFGPRPSYIAKTALAAIPSRRGRPGLFRPAAVMKVLVCIK